MQHPAPTAASQARRFRDTRHGADLPVRRFFSNFATGLTVGSNRAALIPPQDEKYPQLLHHSPYRPRQINTCRPPARIHQHRSCQGHGSPGARRHGPGARAWHHHKEPRHPDGIQAGRRNLHPQPHRHTGTRRFLIRGVALHCRLRGRVAHRRRFARHSGADHLQPLHGYRQRPRNHTRNQQVRPRQRKPRRGGRPDS